MAARQIEEMKSVRAVIVRGNTSVFSAGMDLKQTTVANYENLSVEERMRIHAGGARACKAFEELDAITISAVEGHCIGGGLAFCVATDFRIAGRSATFQAPELLHGMNMSWQSVPRIVSLVGLSRARALILQAKKINAQAALEWSLVDEVVDDDNAFESAIAQARAVVSMPSAGMRMSKHAINLAAGPLNNAVSFMDLEQYAICQETDAHRSAVHEFNRPR